MQTKNRNWQQLKKKKKKKSVNNFKTCLVIILIISCIVYFGDLWTNHLHLLKKQVLFHNQKSWGMIASYIWFVVLKMYIFHLVTYIFMSLTVSLKRRGLTMTKTKSPQTEPLRSQREYVWLIWFFFFFFFNTSTVKPYVK